MSKKRNLATTLIVAIALIVCIVVIFSFRPPNSSSSDADIAALGSVPPIPLVTVTVTVPVTATVPVLATVPVVPLITSTVIYRGTPVTVVDRRYILAGKSPDEVGQFVVRKVAPNFIGPEGPIQVRLARLITREEMPQLGLGCLPDNSGIEEPPFMLVILQGDFARVRMPSPMELPTHSRYHYSAFIIDVWAAFPTTIINSGDGSDFREILNDPSLPEATPEPQPNCPPRIPGNYPHGALLPGIVFPTAPPVPTSTREIFPPPVPTQNP